ncbi:MAG: hypothetical protein GWN84_20535 [Gammaproteobacteria bacterium]|nr:hypothetical protein [Gammaproteobacteria bacterium]NIR85149.1 hypothetical protein [Gammaproteobacteria bacterium]NIU06198.1 hypothetical protein [Gammaproteobacteria bacterium]NIX87471.1 hypothetical protein [Gammaproteobacteria bacterium]
MVDVFQPSGLVGLTYDRRGVIGGIWLDAVVRELHSMRSKATRHPLESGGEIVDHVITEPDAVSLECRVTRNPTPRQIVDAAKRQDASLASARVVERDIDIPPPDVIDAPFGLEVSTSLAIGTTSLALPLPGRKATVSFVDGVQGRIDDVFAELRAIHDEKRIVTIRTSLREYENMVLEDIPVNVGPGEAGRILKFSVTAVAIRTAESKLVDAPEPTQDRFKPVEDAGAQAGSDMEDSEVGAEKASALHGVFF